MFGTAGSPSLRLADSGVTSSMADNGISSLFAMEGDQMSLEDKVVSAKDSHRQRQLYGKEIFVAVRTSCVQAPSLSDQPGNTMASCLYTFYVHLCTH
ncbi:hypothetical protein CsSME_00030367 [Camellia sinensis var. sinensis]